MALLTSMLVKEAVSGMLASCPREARTGKQNLGTGMDKEWNAFSSSPLFGMQSHCFSIELQL